MMSGNKTAANMYVQAYNLINDGKKEAAKSILLNIIDNFPGTPEAERSKNLLEEMGEASSETAETPNPPVSGRGLIHQYQDNSVIVTDIDMPFSSMVLFMVKWSLASIPAVIILGIVVLIFSAVTGGLFASMFR